MTNQWNPDEYLFGIDIGEEDSDKLPTDPMAKADLLIQAYKAFNKEYPPLKWWQKILFFIEGIFHKPKA